MFGYICYNEFESDVIPDSGKTVIRSSKSGYLFESDVIPDSGKTFSIYSLI